MSPWLDWKRKPGERRPAPTVGSLDSESLRKLLLSAQVNRWTDALRLTGGERTCSLYFLFGHLFHAASDGLTGESALQDCLTWPDGSFTFDGKAQLPREEPIERPIDQILAA